MGTLIRRTAQTGLVETRDESAAVMNEGMTEGMTREWTWLAKGRERESSNAEYGRGETATITAKIILLADGTPQGAVLNNTKQRAKGPLGIGEESAVRSRCCTDSMIPESGY